MSLIGRHYIIAGFDLTPYDRELITEEWAENPDNEKYWNNQTVGTIQLFDDQSGGSHLFWGYIVASGDEYNYEDQEMGINEIQRMQYKVLTELQNTGMNWQKLPEKAFEYKLISFVEYM